MFLTLLDTMGSAASSSAASAASVVVNTMPKDTFDYQAYHLPSMVIGFGAFLALLVIVCCCCIYKCCRRGALASAPVLREAFFAHQAQALSAQAPATPAAGAAPGRPVAIEMVPAGRRHRQEDDADALVPNDQ